MIHIIHTPASTLARRRRRLAGHCSCWVVAMVCIAGGWALHIPVFQATGAGPCNFTGVAFIPADEAEPCPQKANLRQPAAAAAAAPTLPPIPALTADCDVCTGELDLLQATPADDILLATNAEALQEPPHTTESPQTPATAEEAESTYTPPAFLRCPRPPYPLRMKQRKIHGNVSVIIHINADGSPSEVIITDTCGNPQLDRHTRNWILQHWLFTPARRGNTHLPSQVKTCIIYALY